MDRVDNTGLGTCLVTGESQFSVSQLFLLVAFKKTEQNNKSHSPVRTLLLPVREVLCFASTRAVPLS